MDRPEFHRLAEYELNEAVHQVVRDLDGNLLNDHIVRHIYAFEDGLIKSMEIQEGEAGGL